ncbi:circularly permuted type 2 ATP-grasp protein [Rhodomicrobium vannielii ATCC 17100]|uniref:circularly permuted type 2 ATP-grasp protein n=1 Tax=Rhodomicrobium vannielii TaxID=1069 RepID=UPI00191A0EF2|nr:circularly permuted type 2 ATP-grasp protein [Rhodomicrobium vannielii]MBJ7533734.1 circularly permuted type 2 ATP-grasp protein [Rhodomicrobium vannielii ATCC 17100]
MSSTVPNIIMPQDLLAAYTPPAVGHDEAIDADGRIRPQWQGFSEAFGAVPPEEQAQRQERLRRLVAENGIAHDLFAEPGSRQPWSIDLIPIMISAAEWAVLERGMIQRVQLCDMMAKDFYGPQTLLRSGRVPPRLVFSDPAFLRACREPKNTGHLINFFAADLIRDASGEWRIIDVHAETPAGVGFALANRLLHGQLMGDVFRTCRAVRLASHFQEIQSELLQRIERDDPLITLLTPGPQHDDYFSHAYLSRYLGFQLVEGGDLRVIGSRVYMKTLEGLKPIDLMIRCVEGSHCDPLELDPNGFAGPVGLVQALRRNPRLMMNFLGSSIIENRGLGPLLPDISRALLGQDLVLHDTHRRWLGDMESRVYVFAHPERFVIRRVHEGTGRPGRAEVGIMLETLTPKALDALRFELDVNGQDYVAEERSDSAYAPSWTADGLTSRRFAMRLFVAGIDGDYRVMPGGLAMSLDGTPGVAMSARDGHSRDVWIASDEEVMPPHISLMRPAAEVARVLRAGIGLRSRIADNLYWLGRYCERADWVMRLMRGALSRSEDSGTVPIGAGGRRALELILSKDQPASAPGIGHDPRAIEQSVRLLMTAPGRSHSLPGLESNILRVGSIVRERLSLEVWQTLLRFSNIASPQANDLSDSVKLLDRLNAGIVTMASLNGLTAENMTRNYGWRFTDIGRRLERAYNLAELLLALFGEVRREDDETARLFFVLNVADSTITFRQRYLFAPILSLVLDLLMVDEANPRGIGFQLCAITDHLQALPQASPHAPHNEEQRLILELLTKVRLAKVASLEHADASGNRVELQELLGALLSGLPKLSEAITRRYFNLTEEELRRVYTRFGSHS